ncbi:MAG TPA: ABC transporter substrate-binding protein, partial [Candidatus Dormibacteraeota bacterium]|nr:ABC transporter substrate-binding protein [Candidatus Dormibacteraeota bacterium]
TPSTPTYLDPQVSYVLYDFGIMQNVYEPLLWYNSTCSTCVVPWLAQSYTSSSDLKSYQFTLRPGIKFADGENLDSTAVYFALNRLLVMDGSSPVGHGTQTSWIVQQLLNTSLSTTLCACTHTYNSAYVDSVLAENFVQITTPSTFTINVMNPNSAFPYLLGNEWADIVAPNYVMQHDVALWNQSKGYTLPYPSLSVAPDEMTMIKDYFYDEAATCNSGITPSGCGTTYLDQSYDGSMAGTGPYWIQSVGKSSNDIVLQANPNYWGGPYATKMIPQYQTAYINYVPDEITREIDLRNAAGSGQAMTVDISGDHLYDVANRNMWIENKQIQSTIQGVTLYGPYSSYTTSFDPFDTNVTNIFTGKPQTFQPFADRRFRLAFADAVNMTQLDQDINNNLGQVAVNLIPPGLPPQGSYNANNTPLYSYNLDAVQSLLLDAMMHPITSFNFENGTAAPPGTFNNAFGCSTLSPSGTCTTPIPQTITIVAPTGDTVDLAIMNTIAANVNNVSSTYNMGLTVTVEPLPFGTMVTEAFSYNLYMWAGFWEDDYPWTIDFLGPMYAPSQALSGPEGWNIPALGTLYKDAVKASALGDDARIISDTNAMNTIANQAVMYLWTFYPLGGWDATADAVIAFTSNVAGFYWNPSTIVDGPYFASLAPLSMTTTTSSAVGAPTTTITTAAVAVVIAVVIVVAAMVLRSRSKKTKT